MMALLLFIILTYYPLPEYLKILVSGEYMISTKNKLRVASEYLIFTGKNYQTKPE